MTTQQTAWQNAQPPVWWLGAWTGDWYPTVPNRTPAPSATRAATPGSAFYGRSGGSTETNTNTAAKHASNPTTLRTWPLTGSTTHKQTNSWKDG